MGESYHKCFIGGGGGLHVAVPQSAICGQTSSWCMREGHYFHPLREQLGVPLNSQDLWNSRLRIPSTSKLLLQTSRGGFFSLRCVVGPLRFWQLLLRHIRPRTDASSQKLCSHFAVSLFPSVPPWLLCLWKEARFELELELNLCSTLHCCNVSKRMNF